MIEAEALVYDYPSKRALDGVSFTVRPGDVLALVGPNGAGKTTLLRLLAALDRPFSGRVRVDGRDAVLEPRRVHERIGYLPDFFGLYDDLTVARCLTYAARARGVSAHHVRAAVEKAAVRVGLADRLGARASELSRGLRQRLAIGQAIVHEPSALLLDEPAAGLDPEARASLSDLILALAAEKMAIIVSSHILAELEDYCSAMLILRDGKLVRGGPIHAGGGPGMTRLRIGLTAADPRLAQLLPTMPELQVLELGDGGALVELRADPEAAADLLAALVGAGLRVTTFAPERQSLEQVYLGAAREVAR
ncbi:MAG: ABC transporter ATP-binding protein [Alphaproteobacteria bacterium]|nr:ABC transporter ATP-binding protein [Alphaproteobacteria bacterium]